jgi:hypothetical protein
MAIIKAINSRASIGNAIRYITKEEKTEARLVGGYHCDPQTALDDMMDTKRAWGKTDGRSYKHFVQSFPKTESITLEEANQIAAELIRRCPMFRGYEICYATHSDRRHVHTHLIVNSVSFEDGKKFRYSNRQLQELKDISDSVLLEYGKNVCEKGREITSFKMGAYRSIEKAVNGEYKSWLYNTMVAVDKAMKTVTSREKFITAMASMGYTVNWQDSRKYITFTHPDGKKVRDKTLSQVFKIPLNQEVLLNDFSKNTETGRNTVVETIQVRPGERKPNGSGIRRSDRAVAKLRQRMDRISGNYRGRVGRTPQDDRSQAGHAGGQQHATTEQYGQQTPRVHRNIDRGR